jgi:hypothetical protein
MSSFPCLVRFVSGSGQVRYRLGDKLVDRYLEFVAGRCRPNTPRAVAFDLKAFFTVTGKDPLEVAAADVGESCRSLVIPAWIGPAASYGVILDRTGPSAWGCPHLTG